MNSHDQLKRLKRQKIILLISISLMLVVTLVISAATIYYSNVRTNLDRDLQSFRSLTQDITYYDEVLTMSARVGVYRGDPKWELRYREYELLLIRALNEAIRLNPVIETALEQTSQANERLIDIENEAFRLSLQNEQDKAIALLYGDEYEALKEEYSEGLQGALNQVYTEIEQKTLEDYRNIANNLLILLANFAVILTGSCLYLLYYLRSSDRYIEELISSLEVSVAEEQRISEELAAASEAKSRFLANMSHEIRTPLNGIMGMLNLLGHSNLNPEQQKKVNIATDSSKNLLTIINDILDFSKIEAGMLTVESIDFDLRESIEQTIRSFALAAEKQENQLIADLSGIDQDIVIGDPTRTIQIISNLLSNAIKFTNKGDVVIKAWLEESESLDMKFHCQIVDTGIGMSEEGLKKVFESFTQSDTSTTRIYGGTGLGLTICKQLVELLGGQLTATSELGKGSAFSFSFPMSKGKSSKKVFPKTNVEGLRVLVVDDNETNREILKNQLEYWGVFVDLEDSARNALSTCKREETYDLALIDYHMPQVNGLELAKRLRTEEKMANTALIIVTSTEMSLDLTELGNLGINGFFTKPLLTDDLFKALALSKSHTENENTPITHEQPVLRSEQWPSGTRVLVAEDDDINWLVIQTMLKHFGIDSDRAINGRETIELLNNPPNDHRYPIILMDCQMPEMDGYEAAQKIRDGAAGEHYRNTPIIAQTANALKQDREKSAVHGMSDIVVKPIEENDLREKLETWLPKHG